MTEEKMPGKTCSGAEGGLNPEKCEVLDRVADFVLRRKLGLPAILFLESVRPLHFIGAQALLFFEPFLNILLNGEKLRLFREAMEDKRYLDYLVERIENPEKSRSG